MLISYLLGAPLGRELGIQGRVELGVPPYAKCEQLMTPLSAYYQDGAMGVPDDAIGDTPHESPSHSLESPTPHNYEADAYLLAQANDLFVWLPYPGMNPRNSSPSSLDFSYLLIE